LDHWLNNTQKIWKESSSHLTKTDLSGVLLFKISTARLRPLDEAGLKAVAPAINEAALADIVRLEAEHAETETALTKERDDLTAQVETLTSERDGLTTERDGLTSERDGLTGQVASHDDRARHGQNGARHGHQRARHGHQREGRTTCTG
jgi:hypothetical protein